VKIAVLEYLCGGGLIEHLLFCGLDFGVWCIIEIIQIFGIQGRTGFKIAGRERCSTLQEFQLSKSGL
jgi:hypothetical protein